MSNGLKCWLKLCKNCEHYLRRKTKRYDKSGYYDGFWRWGKVMVCNIVYGNSNKEARVADKEFRVPQKCPYRLEKIMRDKP